MFVCVYIIYMCVSSRNNGHTIHAVSRAGLKRGAQCCVQNRKSDTEKDIYIYIYIYTEKEIYIYIYIYGEREREREIIRYDTRSRKEGLCARPLSTSAPCRRKLKRPSATSLSVTVTGGSKSISCSFSCRSVNRLILGWGPEQGGGERGEWRGMDWVSPIRNEA